jgi:hypothetical protein
VVGCFGKYQNFSFFMVAQLPNWKLVAMCVNVYLSFFVGGVKAPNKWPITLCECLVFFCGGVTAELVAGCFV